MNKIITFKEQIKSLTIEELWRIEQFTKESPNLHSVNPIAKQLIINTIREEIRARQGVKK